MFCPFQGKKRECSRDCALWHTGQRQYTGKVDTVTVEGCVFNLMFDELTNHSLQNSIQHKELGETKNTILYTALSSFGVKKAQDLLEKKARKLIGVRDATPSK